MYVTRSVSRRTGRSSRPPELDVDAIADVAPVLGGPGGLDAARASGSPLEHDRRSRAELDRRAGVVEREQERVAARRAGSRRRAVAVGSGWVPARTLDPGLDPSVELVDATPPAACRATTAYSATAEDEEHDERRAAAPRDEAPADAADQAARPRRGRPARRRRRAGRSGRRQPSARRYPTPRTVSILRAGGAELRPQVVDVRVDGVRASRRR